MSGFAHASWPALGTTASVTVTNARALALAREAVEADLAAIDQSCSRFREDSELSRLNAGAGRSVRVGPLLLEAITVALRAAALTDGAVDPTVGQALILAGYDRDFAKLRPIDAPVKAVRVPGWQKVAVDQARGRVRIPGGVTLDLGATAKALAADRAVASVAAAAPGIGAMVNLGGDIALAGPAPSGGWRVRLADDHRASPRASGQSVAVRSGGLATSSTTVRRWGRGSHHIIDPGTGAPAAECWRTVSVAAASCVDANIASTAAIVRGGSAAKWLEDLHLPARLVERHGGVLTVAGWPRELVSA